jgi:methylated-DNA-[protein]-cysteine S-methyltransferase
MMRAMAAPDGRVGANDGVAAPGAPQRLCALFATPIGECGLAWQGGALTHVLLPAADAAATRSLLRHLSHAEPAFEPMWPTFVQDAVAAMQSLLRGEAASLAAVPLAWHRVGEFEREVYELARRLAPGETSTYGDLARTLGDPGAARAVGAALGRNPWPLVVPCHRVLATGGKLGGFSAPGGVATKARLLAIEAPLARREGQLF